MLQNIIYVFYKNKKVMTQEEKIFLIDLIDKKIKDNNSWIKYEIDTHHHEVDIKSNQRIEKYKENTETLLRIRNKLTK